MGVAATTKSTPTEPEMHCKGHHMAVTWLSHDYTVFLGLIVLQKIQLALINGPSSPPGVRNEERKWKGRVMMKQETKAIVIQ